MEPQHHERPFFGFDEQDQSAVLAIVAITAMLITGLVMASKLFYRSGLRILRDCDYILLLGAVLLLVQSVLLVKIASLGVGKHTASLDNSVIDKISKLQYTIVLLGILVAYCAKFCMCLFIRAINTYTSIKRANNILMTVLGVFFLSSFLANVLRCPLPTPWVAASRETCSAAIPIHDFTIISIMLTDVVLVALAVSMVARIQTRLTSKMMIISLFSSRLLAAGTLGPAMVDTSYIFNGPDTDFTWPALYPMVWLTVSSHLTIITACMPGLKGIFDSWLGNTLGVGMDAPYELERIEGKGGFAVSARPQTESSYARNGYHNSKRVRNQLAKLSDSNQSAERRSRAAALFASSTAALKLTTASPNQAACFSNHPTRAEQRESKRVSGHLRTKDDDESESVKGLTDGVIMIRDDVEVKYEEFDPQDGHSYSSRDSKH